jgi:hypothetical protein
MPAENTALPQAAASSAPVGPPVTARLIVKSCSSLTNMGTSPDMPQTDAFVQVFLDSDCVLQTPVMRNDLAPSFDPKSSNVVLDVSPLAVISVQVWHKATRSSDSDRFLGEALISGQEVVANRSLTVGCGLHKRRKEPDNKIAKLDKDGLLGTVHVSWAHVAASESPAPLAAAANAIPSTLLGSISLIEGRNLLKRDSGEKQLSDPYFLLFSSSPSKKKTLIWKSSVFDCTLNPVVPPPAPQVPVYGSVEDPSAHVIIEAWNANPKPERDSFLGMRKLLLRSLPQGQSRADLQPRPKEVEALISRLEGRLGWVVVRWEPTAEMLKVAAVEQPGGDAQGGETGRPVLDVALLNSILSSTRGSVGVAESKTGQQPAAAEPAASAVVSPTVPSRPQSMVVPVEMTDIIPILVADDYGDSLYTELKLDSAVGELQPLIQAHFNVHVSVQMLKCNGQLVQPNLSLRRNGCLLLQGEPYVKIHMSVAKGPNLALVFVLPDKREIPLAFPETATVKRVKEELCAVEGVALDPKDIRLLWRYNELNDKATLEYYRVVTRTRINVAKKPLFFEDGKEFVDDRREPVAAYKPEGAAYRPEGANGMTYGGGSVLTKRQGEESRTKETLAAHTAVKAGDARPSSAKRTGHSGDRAPDSDRKAATVGGSAAARPSSAKRTGSATRDEKQSAKPKTSSGPSAASASDQFGRYTVENRPRAYYEADAAGLDDPELSYLRRQVKQLETQVLQQTSVTVAKSSVEEEVKVQRLERKLLESDRLLMEALARVSELEGTVRRYQDLVQKLSSR